MFKVAFSNKCSLFFFISIEMLINIRAETCQLFKKTKTLEKHKNIMPCSFAFEGEQHVTLKSTNEVNEFEQLIYGIF